MLKLWNEYLDLFQEEAIIKKEAKEERKKLEKVIWDKYKTLSIDEVKEIIVVLKWLKTVNASINSEMDAINKRLTGRIKEIAERYEYTLGVLDSECNDLEKKVKAHLENMGLV